VQGLTNLLPLCLAPHAIAHPFWQGRLPPCFASEHIAEIELTTPHIDALRLHRNAHETHRELRMIPQHAWELARKERRSVLRPAPRCPWWPYVWSVRTTIKVGSDGSVPIGPQRLRLERLPGAKVVLCLHPTDHHSVLASPPDSKAKPLAPLHKPLKMNLSCFENYATRLKKKLASNPDSGKTYYRSNVSDLVCKFSPLSF